MKGEREGLMEEDGYMPPLIKEFYFDALNGLSTRPMLSWFDFEITQVFWLL